MVGGLSDVLAPAFGRDSLRYAMLIMSCSAFGVAHYFRKAGEVVVTELQDAAAARCALATNAALNT